MAKVKTATEEPLEKQLWKATDKLRKNIDAAEYKHIVRGLIFLKYISDSEGHKQRRFIIDPTAPYVQGKPVKIQQ